jgi:hypothetical protein
VELNTINHQKLLIFHLGFSYHQQEFQESSDEFELKQIELVMWERLRD